MCVCVCVCVCKIISGYKIWPVVRISKSRGGFRVRELDVWMKGQVGDLPVSKKCEASPVYCLLGISTVKDLIVN